MLQSQLLTINGKSKTQTHHPLFGHNIYSYMNLELFHKRL